MSTSGRASRDPSITTLRSYMGVGPLDMDIDHAGSSPWDGELPFYPSNLVRLQTILRMPSHLHKLLRRSRTIRGRDRK